MAASRRRSASTLERGRPSTVANRSASNWVPIAAAIEVVVSSTPDSSSTLRRTCCTTTGTPERGRRMRRTPSKSASRAGLGQPAEEQRVPPAAIDDGGARRRPNDEVPATPSSIDAALAGAEGRSHMVSVSSASRPVRHAASGHQQHQLGDLPRRPSSTRTSRLEASSHCASSTTSSVGPPAAAATTISTTSAAVSGRASTDTRPLPASASTSAWRACSMRCSSPVARMTHRDVVTSRQLTHQPGLPQPGGGHHHHDRVAAADHALPSVLQEGGLPGSADERLGRRRGVAPTDDAEHPDAAGHRVDRDQAPGNELERGREHVGGRLADQDHAWRAALLDLRREVDGSTLDVRGSIGRRQASRSAGRCGCRPADRRTPSLSPSDGAARAGR